MSRRWFNPVDLCCIAVGVMLLQWTISIGQLVRQSAPRVTGLEPNIMREEETQWVKVRGEHFRDARLMLIGDRIISPLIDTSEREFFVQVTPHTLGLVPGRYDVLVVNGWGHGARLPDALTVMEAPTVPPTVILKEVPTIVLKEVPTIVLKEVPTIVNEVPDFLQTAPTAWVTTEGWVRMTRPMLHALCSREEAYDASGRMIARILKIAPDIFSETEAPFPMTPDRLLAPIGDTSLLAIVPRKWLVRHVTLKLLAQHWRGTFYFQRAPLVHEGSIVVTTPRYRIPIRVIGGATRYDPFEGSVTVRVRSQDLPAIARLSSGDPVTNVHGDVVGKVVKHEHARAQELELWLHVEPEGVVWWHERTKLRWGNTLTVGTPEGAITGKIVKVFPQHKS